MAVRPSMTTFAFPEGTPSIWKLLAHLPAATSRPRTSRHLSRTPPPRSRVPPPRPTCDPTLSMRARNCGSRYGPGLAWVAEAEAYLLDELAR